MKRTSLLCRSLVGFCITSLPLLNAQAIPPAQNEFSVLLQGPESPTRSETSAKSAAYVADSRMGAAQGTAVAESKSIAAPSVPETSVPENSTDLNSIALPNESEYDVGDVAVPNLDASGTVSLHEGSEVVRDRFDNGKMRVERQVALDAEGNFVNHGRYQEWTRDGDLLMTGDYEMGQRVGMWVRIHTFQEGGIFKSAPYTQFKPPFTSQVNFLNGQMHGEWIIRDADGKVISEIQLEHGVRNGTAAWNHPSGIAMFEAHYKGGILDGAYIERDVKGTELSRSVFKLGQRIEVEREQYSNKRLKSEYQYLSAPQQMVTMDDWALAKFATYDKQGDRIKHGTFAVYYENGELKAKGAYVEGVLDGLYQSWHANGQLEAQGTYRQGAQDGDWNWWHNNGMRQATGKYVDGRPAGSVMQWKADGTRIDGSTVQLKPSQPSPAAANTPLKRQAAQRRVYNVR